jgi:hypothetical protein
VSEDTIERAVNREHRVSCADFAERKAGFVSLRRKQFGMVRVTVVVWFKDDRLN